MGIGIKNLLEYRKDDEKFQELVASWHKTIVVEVNGIYAVTITFEGGAIDIQPGTPEKYDLKFQLSLETMVAIARGDISYIKAFLKGHVKVKKMWHVGTLLKFVKVFIPALQIAGQRARNFQQMKERGERW